MTPVEGMTVWLRDIQNNLKHTVHYCLFWLIFHPVFTKLVHTILSWACICFLPVVCNWLSKFKGNTLSSENVGFLVYLFLHGSLLYLCSGFRGSHYGSPCPPIHHMKTSLESLRLTALFVRQRWVSTRKAVKWLVVICIYVFLTGSGTGYYVCCKLLEKMALCLSSVLPCVHGFFLFVFWPL